MKRHCLITCNMSFHHNHYDLSSIKCNPQVLGTPVGTSCSFVSFSLACKISFGRPLARKDSLGEITSRRSVMVQFCSSTISGRGLFQ